MGMMQSLRPLFKSMSSDSSTDRPQSAGAELSPLCGGKSPTLSHRFDGTTLLTQEIFWRDHQAWLKEKGYMLRPRYRPGWEASWIKRDNSSFYWNYEDGLLIPEHGMLDATRLRDGEMVMLRRISDVQSPDELRIHRYLLEKEPDESALNGKGHIVPIYEVMEVPDSPSDSIVVMPYLRPSSDPRFRTVEEAVEFFKQALVGVQFMHQSRVAHGSCNFKGVNIMMDPKAMFPDMHHPAAINKTRGFSRDARSCSRAEAGDKLKYYWVNFQRSTSERAAMKKAQVSTTNTPIDSFAEDIGELGIMIWENFLTKTDRLAFMHPLVIYMMNAEPSERPTIDEVVVQFGTLVDTLSKKKLKSRLDAPLITVPQFLLSTL